MEETTERQLLSDVSTLKGDVAAAKADVATTKDVVADLRGEMRDIGKGFAEMEVHGKYARDRLDKVELAVGSVRDHVDTVRGALQTQALTLDEIRGLLTKISSQNGTAAAIPPQPPPTTPTPQPPAANGDKAEKAQEEAAANFLGKYILVPFVKKAGPLIAAIVATALATWLGMRLIGGQKTAPAPAPAAVGSPHAEMGPPAPAATRVPAGGRTVPNGD